MTEESALPEAVQAAVPKTGLIREYLEHAARAQPKAQALHHLGCIIPTLLAEMNMSGVSVEGLTIDGYTASPLNWWSLLIGASGCGKTTAINFCRGWWRREAKLYYGNEYIDPFVRLEGSSEGLVGRIRAQQEEADAGATSVLLWQDELAVVLANRHMKAETLQQLHDSAEIERHTVGQQQQAHQGTAAGSRGSRLMPGYGLNAIFAMTPEHIDTFTGAMTSGGLFGRMQWFNPGASVLEHFDRIGLATSTEREEPLRQAATEWLKHWEALLVTDGGTTIRYSIEAKRHALALWRPWVETYQQSGHVSEAMNSLVTRLPFKTAILAALYASTTCEAGLISIEPEHLDQAAAMIRLNMEHAQVMSTFAGASVNGKWQAAAEQAIAGAGAKGVSRGELYHAQGLRGQVSKRDLDQTLDTLIDTGDVVQLTFKLGKRGRPPIRLWVAKKLPEWLRDAGATDSGDIEMSADLAQKHGIIGVSS